MSQAYIHACERAELLGFPIPSEEEWKETQKSEENVDNDDDAMIQNLDSSSETTQRISGGLDELNSILNVTQKKINRFKNICGSLGSLLKVKVGSKNNTPDNTPDKLTEQSHNEIKNINPETSMNEENLIVELSDDKKHMENTETIAATSKAIDINKKMGSHLNKLDSLITKAENAQYSMQFQTKQMKKFLK